MEKEKRNGWLSSVSLKTSEKWKQRTLVTFILYIQFNISPFILNFLCCYFCQVCYGSPVPCVIFHLCILSCFFVTSCVQILSHLNHVWTLCHRRNEKEVWKCIFWGHHGYSRLWPGFPILALLWIWRSLWPWMHCCSPLLLWWLINVTIFLTEFTSFPWMIIRA